MTTGAAIASCGRDSEYLIYEVRIRTSSIDTCSKADPRRILEVRYLGAAQPSNAVLINSWMNATGLDRGERLCLSERPEVSLRLAGAEVRDHDVPVHEERLVLLDWYHPDSMLPMIRRWCSAS